MKSFSIFNVWSKSFFVSLISLYLISCGGDNNTHASKTNHAPVISGNPTSTIALGQTYEFTPMATDANGDSLFYSILNKPEWANFDTASGRLVGLADVEGTYSNIIISVSDARNRAVLDAFNIVVTSQASLSNVSVVSEMQGSTPFINFLMLQAQQLNNVKYVEYTIQPKPNSVSKAVNVKYSRIALQDRGYIPGEDSIVLPVYGLYEGYENHVSLNLEFEDTSSKAISYIVNTSQYEEPNKTYDRPVILKKRKMDAELGFDFFAIKSLAGTPVIVDTDGELRWAATIPAVTSSGSAIFHNNAFVIGDPKSTKFFSFELDGKMTESVVPVSSYTNFHHNIDAGKSGYLGEFDAETNGVKNIESIIAEFDLSGAVLKEWDFSKIIFDYMTAASDDPSNFIRAGVDWFHSNAATYDPLDNSLIVSSRENFVIKLDYETNEIIWVLGDPTKYWHYLPSLSAKAITLDSGIYPVGQHAVSITSDGLLLLFNNGAASFNQPSWAPVGNRGVTVLYRPIKLIQLHEVEEKCGVLIIMNQYCPTSAQVYTRGDKSFLISYATASNRTKARLVGLNKDRDVIFDFEYPSTRVCTSWNAVPIGLDKMNIM